MNPRLEGRPRAEIAGAALMLLVLVPALGAPILSLALGIDPETIDPTRVFAPPSRSHPLGTDDLGRDVLARLLYGGRISLGIAAAAGLVSVAIGGGLGLVSGFFGGAIDAVLMRVTDALRALPKLPILLLLASISLEKLGVPEAVARSSAADAMKLVAVIVLLGWTGAARLARASALQLREAEFVLAARALGAPSSWILRRHILPHALPPLLVAGAVDVGEMVIYESALSFLGLGIRPPTPSWGAMLSNGLSHLSVCPPLVALPLISTFVAVSGAHLLADGLRERFDPRRGTDSLRRDAELM